MAKVDPSKIYFTPYDQNERNAVVKATHAGHKFKNRRSVLIIICSIVALASIPALAFLIYRIRFETTFTAAGLPDYSDEYHSSINDDPIQIAVNGIETGSINGIKARINYEAYYDITAYVASVHDYYGFGFFDTYVPRDVCLVWGNLKDSLSDSDVTYRQYDRHCYMSYQNYEIKDVSKYYNGAFRNKYSDFDMSNNHIIPATTEIRAEILGLRRGDKVRLIGYLVYAYSENQENLISSLRRDDSGDGACEVFFVTKVEKN